MKSSVQAYILGGILIDGEILIWPLNFNPLLTSTAHHYKLNHFRIKFRKVLELLFLF